MHGSDTPTETEWARRLWNAENDPETLRQRIERYHIKMSGLQKTVVEQRAKIADLEETIEDLRKAKSKFRLEGMRLMPSASSGMPSLDMERCARCDGLFGDTISNWLPKSKEARKLQAEIDELRSKLDQLRNLYEARGTESSRLRDKNQEMREELLALRAQNEAPPKDQNTKKEKEEVYRGHSYEFDK